MAINKTTLYSTGLGESVSAGKGGLLVNGSVTTVDTIADLQALPTSGLVDGQEIHISTTGRAGVFVVRAGDFQAEVDNDSQSGVWVKFADATATSIVAMRLYNSWGAGIDVQWFGAAGDDTTDDSVALNACFKYSLLKNGSVYIPEKSFYVASSVGVTQADGSRLYVAGKGRQSQIRTDQNIDVIRVEGVSGTTFQYPTFRDFAVSASTGLGGCFFFRYTEFMDMRGCYIVGGSTGVSFCPNPGESDFKPRIESCYFGLNSSAIVSGQGDTRLSDVSFKDNYFLDCETWFINAGYIDGSTITGNKFFRNPTGDPGCNGVKINRPVYAYIKDNDFFEMGGIALKLTSPKYGEFSGNRIINTGGTSGQITIDIQDFDASPYGVVSGVGFKIKDNFIKNTGGSGIVVNSVNSVQNRYQIMGNYLEGVGSATASDAIRLTGCLDFDVDGNIVDGGSVTRYWLYSDISFRTRVNNNEHYDTTQPDAFFQGGAFCNPTLGVKIYIDQTSNRTLTVDDDGVIGGVLTESVFMNLPNASYCPGKKMMFTKTDGSVYSLIIDPAGGQLINGASTLNVDTQYQTITVVSDGGNWFTV